MQDRLSLRVENCFAELCRKERIQARCQPEEDMVQRERLPLFFSCGGGGGGAWANAVGNGPGQRETVGEEAREER